MNSTSRKRQFTELYIEEDLIKKTCETLSTFIRYGFFDVNSCYFLMPESHTSHFFATNCNLKKISIRASGGFKFAIESYISSIGKNDSTSFLSITDLFVCTEDLREKIICGILNIPTITSLELINPGFTEKNFGFYCTHFSSNNSIKHLVLDSFLTPALFDNFSVVLKSNTTLTSLTLTDNLLGDEYRFVDALRSNTTLTSLTLSNNRGLRSLYTSLFNSLSSHASITSLDLSSTNFTYSMTDSIVKLITVNTMLSSLNLSKCGIISQMLDRIFIALKFNTSLTCLKIEKNIGGSNIKSPLFEEFIVSNTTLTTLNMKRNMFSKKRIDGLCHAFSLNSTLTDLNFSRTISSLYPVTNLPKSILSNPSLKRLSLESFSFSSDTIKEIIDKLGTNTVLTSLNLSRGSLRFGSCYALDAFKTNTTLTHLNISGNFFSNASIDRVCSLITTNNTLKHLDVFFSNWNDASKRDLKQALSQNTSLVFLNTESESCSKEKYTGFKNIKKNLTLYELLIHLVL